MGMARTSSSVDRSRMILSTVEETTSSRSEAAGGSGDDYLDGGGGTDSLDGGDGIDTCLFGEMVVNCEL